jgi:hypothetical protein
MVGIRGRESCIDYFRKLKILPLQSKYIYLFLSFEINNRQHFKINSDIHNINTRNKNDLHYPQPSLLVNFTRRVHITLRLRYLTDCVFQYKSPFFLLTGWIFQIKYILNFKVVYINCIGLMWLNFCYSLVLEILL